jgi:hypothetical protein
MKIISEIKPSLPKHKIGKKKNFPNGKYFFLSLSFRKEMEELNSLCAAQFLWRT